MTGDSEAGQTTSLTLGEVVRAALPDFAQTHRLPAHHWKVLRAIAACHTPALGGHQYECAHCGRPHFVPHSCGNRHFASCQWLQGAQWLEQQTEHLLPIPYFHVVFTLPHDLNPPIQHNQVRLYSLLFSSATATLLEFGRNNLQATLGVTAVLHPWGQNLGDHYHLYCVVTGGGLSWDGKSWVSLRPQWLFAVRSLSVVFHAKFRDGLQQLFDAGQLQFPRTGPRLSPLATPAPWRQASLPADRGRDGVVRATPLLTGQADFLAGTDPRRIICPCPLPCQIQRWATPTGSPRPTGASC